MHAPKSPCVTIKLSYQNSHHIKNYTISTDAMMAQTILYHGFGKEMSTMYKCISDDKRTECINTFIAVPHNDSIEQASYTSQATGSIVVVCVSIMMINMVHTAQYACNIHRSILHAVHYAMHRHPDNSPKKILHRRLYADCIVLPDKTQSLFLCGARCINYNVCYGYSQEAEAKRYRKSTSINHFEQCDH